MRLEKILSVAIAILTIGGMVYVAYSKPANWDQAVRDVAEMKPQVQDHGNRLASVEAHFADIKDSLRAINEKLDQ